VAQGACPFVGRKGVEQLVTAVAPAPRPVAVSGDHRQTDEGVAHHRRQPEELPPAALDVFDEENPEHHQDDEPEPHTGAEPGIGRELARLDARQAARHRASSGPRCGRGPAGHVRDSGETGLGPGPPDLHRAGTALLEEQSRPQGDGQQHRQGQPDPRRPSEREHHQCRHPEDARDRRQHAAHQAAAVLWPAALASSR
jgi:hypothetical protein